MACSAHMRQQAGTHMRTQTATQRAMHAVKGSMACSCHIYYIMHAAHAHRIAHLVLVELKVGVVQLVELQLMSCSHKGTWQCQMGSDGLAWAGAKHVCSGTCNLPMALHVMCAACRAPLAAMRAPTRVVRAAKCEKICQVKLISTDLSWGQLGFIFLNSMMGPVYFYLGGLFLDLS